jgi:hypothetical protein
MKKGVAVELVSKCSWNGRIKTSITPSEGELPESFERTGLQLVLPDSGAVTEAVDAANFYTV